MIQKKLSSISSSSIIAQDENQPSTKRKKNKWGRNIFFVLKQRNKKATLSEAAPHPPGLGFVLAKMKKPILMLHFEENSR